MCRKETNHPTTPNTHTHSSLQVAWQWGEWAWWLPFPPSDGAAQGLSLPTSLPVVISEDTQPPWKADAQAHTLYNLPTFECSPSYLTYREVKWEGHVSTFPEAETLTCLIMPGASTPFCETLRVWGLLYWLVRSSLYRVDSCLFSWDLHSRNSLVHLHSSLKILFS